MSKTLPLLPSSPSPSRVSSPVARLSSSTAAGACSPWIFFVLAGPSLIPHWQAGWLGVLGLRPGTVKPGAAPVTPSLMLASTVAVRARTRRR